MASLIARGGWGDREEAVMKRATVDDYLEAIRSLDGKEFKLFLLKTSTSSSMDRPSTRTLAMRATAY